jgi:hypothetical protein
MQFAEPNACGMPESVTLARNFEAILDHACEPTNGLELRFRQKPYTLQQHGLCVDFHASLPKIGGLEFGRAAVAAPC